MPIMEIRTGSAGGCDSECFLSFHLCALGLIWLEKEM